MASTMASTQACLNLHLQPGVLSCSPFPHCQKPMGYSTWVTPLLLKPPLPELKTHHLPPHLTPFPLIGPCFHVSSLSVRVLSIVLLLETPMSF